MADHQDEESQNLQQESFEQSHESLIQLSAALALSSADLDVNKVRNDILTYVYFIGPFCKLALKDCAEYLSNYDISYEDIFIFKEALAYNINYTNALVYQLNKISALHPFLSVTMNKEVKPQGTEDIYGPYTTVMQGMASVFAHLHR